VKKIGAVGSSSSYWMMVEDLGLRGELADQWNSHIACLNNLGVRLTYDEDEIIWT